MMFSENMIFDLESRVKDKLSDYRYIHTLGVKNAAIKIAEYCYQGDLSEITAAALLHDISKEYSVAEQFDMMRRSDLDLSDTDLMSHQVFHSFTAPLVIKEEFSEFATSNILSAVFNHTTGAHDMSLFDEIVFIADYIEDGRKHNNCIRVREDLYSAFDSAQNREECIMHLHSATIAALENTIIGIVKNKKVLNERTVATRNAFLARTPSPLVY